MGRVFNIKRESIRLTVYRDNFILTIQNKQLNLILFNFKIYIKQFKNEKPCQQLKTVSETQYPHLARH